MRRWTLEANDAGAIYTGRDWGYRGTIIRHNIIRDLASIFGGSHGVYLDDAVSGMIVVGNHVIDASIRLKCRQRERYGLRPIIQQVVRQRGARWSGPASVVRRPRTCSSHRETPPRAPPGGTTPCGTRERTSS